MNNFINYKFYYISWVEYQELLVVFCGDVVVDYIIDNVFIFDLINGGEIFGLIVIKGCYIVGVGVEYIDVLVLQWIDVCGVMVVSGFIDVYLYIEFSMMMLVIFEIVILLCGLMIVICDFYEIVNVMGEVGFVWFVCCVEQVR